MDFLSGLGKALSNVAGYVGNTIGGWGKQGGATDIVNAIDRGNAQLANGYKKAVSTPTPAPSPQYTMDPSVKAQIDALNRQTAAIQAQIAAQPKLVYRDTNAAWQSAQNTAASSVNPVYQDNLNRKLKEMSDLRLQQQAEAQAQNTASDTTLGQTTEDIATQRERTAEDTASAIAQNMINEGNWQTAEGRQADAQEEAARLALGDQSIAGRGAGQLETAKITRNDESNQQTQGFENDREAKKLLETRTFQDLDTKGVRAVNLNETQKADISRKLNDFIINQGNEEAGFRASNEAARLAALFDATNQQYKTDTATWLSNLVKSGTRNQDVALAYQVYGGR